MRGPGGRFQICGKQTQLFLLCDAGIANAAPSAVVAPLVFGVVFRQGVKGGMGCVEGNVKVKRLFGFAGLLQEIEGEVDIRDRGVESGAGDLLSRKVSSPLKKLQAPLRWPKYR